MSRNVRNLAAWGYESTRTGTRIEIDVWTINQAKKGETDLERARRLLPDKFDVIEAAGNVAKVGYPGAAGVGYRYIDRDSTAAQQAYAGAVRSAGGSRTDAGTFGEGWTVPDDAPDLRACVSHGEREVIPAVRQDLRRAGSRELAQAIERIDRDGAREEENEPVGTSAFRGFKNAVRIYPRNGSPFEYSVDVPDRELRR